MYVGHLYIFCIESFAEFPLLKNVVFCGRKGHLGNLGSTCYILLCLKWITNKALLYSTGKCAHYRVAAWMGGVFGNNGYVYMYG